MGSLDRMFLVIYTLTATILLCVEAVYWAGWPGPLLALSNEVLSPANREIVWVLLIIYLAMGLWLFWKGVRNPRPKTNSIVHEQKLGQVRVSLPAVEALVEKDLTEVQEIKEVKAKVGTVPQGISIDLKVAVATDVNLPVLTGNLQQRVKDNVFNVIGITVHEVRIAVDKFQMSKTRVE